MASKHKGIEERPGVDGKPNYRAKVRVKGFPSQSATFARLTDAVRWKQQTETDIRREKYFPAVEARKHTFGDLVDYYMNKVLPRKPSSEKKQSAQLFFWKERVGEKRRLCDITPAVIIGVRDQLVGGTTYRHKPRSVATVNRYLAVLSHAFSVAIKELQWIKENPASGLKMKEIAPNMRPLSTDEVQTLLTECAAHENRYLYLVVLIALTTGCRLNEAMSLRTSDVQWDEEGACVLTFNKTKNGVPHHISLLGPAKRLLAKHIQSNSKETEFVFPAMRGLKDRPAVIRHAWDEVIAKVGLKNKNVTFHSIRRTVGTMLAKLKVGESVIGKILNHKSSSVTKRYILLANPDVQDALEQLNEFLESGFKVEDKEVNIAQMDVSYSQRASL